MSGRRRSWASGRSVLGWSAVLASLMVAGVVAGACSTGTDSPSVASLPGHAGASAQSSASLTQSQGDRDFIDFARCMRAHGVAMSDPFHRPGHQGLSIDVPAQTASTRGAFRACNHFIAQVTQEKEAAAAQLAPHLQALTNYTQCMRHHDISMLDPTPQGQVNLGNVPGISKGFGRYSPQFRAADGACRHLLPAAVHDDGTGP